MPSAAGLHWYEAHGVERRKLKIKGFLEQAMAENSRRRYALCVQADEGEDIEVRKVYEVLPDELAARRRHVRVVDESGDDYLYPGELFVLLDLSREVERALRPRSTRRTKKHANKVLPRTGQARR